ncbi:MAG: GGDEF domain-containing protein [Rhodospirillales bacterium]|nr:GGDEF domain-containing protein [Rhodospirillales bacterium]
MLSKTDLMESIGINSEELERRRHAFDISESDQQRLRNFSPVLEPELERIVTDFYKRQMADKEIAKMIGAPKVLANLHVHMQLFLSRLFRATYDADYINSRLRVRKVHKTLGVAPKLYMSAISTLQDLVDENIRNLCADDDDVQALHKAFHKALLFDCQFVFEAYIHSYQLDMEEAYGEINDYAAHMEIKIEALTRKAHNESLRDSLTNIFNRRALIDYLERELEIAKRYELPLCLVYFDLNGFKPINDTYGHEAGDNVLRQVGQSLRTISRNVDIPARLGGDEFCIIMPRCDIDNARKPIDRLITDFDQNCKYDVAFSIGVVQTGPEVFEDINTLLKRADGLMYEAKTASRKTPGHQIRYAS